MLRYRNTICLFLVVLIFGGAVLAQEGKKIFAQALVDKTVKKHPELLVLMMHVTPPNNSDNVVIASNIGRLGTKADEDDLSVIRTGKSILEINKKGDRFEVELVLQDQAGNIVGALGTVFAYKAGDKESDFKKKGEEIRDELKKQIPTLEKLFEPAE